MAYGHQFGFMLGTSAKGNSSFIKVLHMVHRTIKREEIWFIWFYLFTNNVW